MSLIGPMALSTALVALAAGSLGAQNTPPESATPPFKITARTVVENVVVLDKNGHAVLGLRRRDFQVFENGKRQAISFFDSNFEPLQAVAVAPPALPPDTFTNVPAVPANDVTNILLLDGLNTPPTEGMYAEVQMVKYLASLPPNLRIGVFTLDKEKFHIVWGLSTDSSALRAAISRFAAKYSHSSSLSTAAQRQSERQELVETVDSIKQTADGVSEDGPDESNQALRQFLNQGTLKYRTANGELFTTMNAFEALAHYLAGIPGRKNLFWLAGSFPYCSKSSAFYDAWYREARDKLTDAGVSVYPIDANGVDVDTGGFQSGGSMSASTSRFVASEGWAEETGGKAYHENDIPQEIADAGEHGSRYYTLAYVPSDPKEDGQERKVEVKVLSGDYKLFYRRSYFEQSQREIAKAGAVPAKDPLVALMGRGMPNIAEIPYQLKIAPTDTQPAAGTPRAGGNKQLSDELTGYDVTFNLLPSGLSLLRADANGERREALEVMVLVYDQSGKPLNWESHTIRLLIKPEQWARARGQGVSFRLQINAPAGDVYLRTGVYDAAQGKVGTLEVPLGAVTATPNSAHRHEGKKGVVGTIR